MRGRDHYARLGVPRNADAKRIRDAYRDLARRYHPDLHPDDPEAEAVLKEINEAYEILSDPDKRRSYNLLGEDWEEIVRDARTRREESAFEEAEEASSWADTGGRTESSWAPPSAGESRRWGRIPAILGVFAILLVAGTASMHRRAERLRQEERQVERLWQATGHIRELQGEMHSLTNILTEGVQVWIKVCPERTPERVDFLDKTVRPNYERRYHAAARAATEGIDRADAAGVFELPIQPTDAAVLESLRDVRQWLESRADEDLRLACDREEVVDHLDAAVDVIGAAEGCLDALSRLGARPIRQRVSDGLDVCKPSSARLPASERPAASL